MDDDRVLSGLLEISEEENQGLRVLLVRCQMCLRLIRVAHRQGEIEAQLGSIDALLEDIDHAEREFERARGDET